MSSSNSRQSYSRQNPNVSLMRNQLSELILVNERWRLYE